MEEEKFKLEVDFRDKSPQTTKNVNSFVGFLKDLGPIIIGIAAIFYAYQQTKETNDTNYKAKTFEITFEDKKKAYVDFMQSIYDFDEIDNYLKYGNDSGKTLNQRVDANKSNFTIKKTALSIHLDMWSTMEFLNNCDSILVAQSNKDFERKNRFMRYFVLVLKPKLFPENEVGKPKGYVIY